MENSNNTKPVVSCPSSPDIQGDMYRSLTAESIHCALEEEQLEDSDNSPPVDESPVSDSQEVFPNHNFSRHQEESYSHDEGSSDTITSPAASSELPRPPTPPSPPPAPSPSLSPPQEATPTGIDQSEMRAPSTEQMYRDMVGDLDVMMDIAKSMHDLARHTRCLLQTAYERVGLDDPRVQNLGIAGVLKDLRQESAHSVVDGQRSQLRYEKVLSDVRKLRRCLRNLGFWRPGGSKSSTSTSLDPPYLQDPSWGLPYHSFFSNSP